MRKMTLAAPLLAVLLLACNGNGGGDEGTPPQAGPTATQSEAVERATATQAAATEEAPSVEVPAEIVSLINDDIAAGNIDGISPDKQLGPNECGRPEVQLGDLCLRSASTTVSETEATIAVAISGLDPLWQIDLERTADGGWTIVGVATFR